MISSSTIALKQLSILLLEVAISSSTREEVVEDTIAIKIEVEVIREVEEVEINFIITEDVGEAASSIIDRDSIRIISQIYPNLLRREEKQQKKEEE